MQVSHVRIDLAIRLRSDLFIFLVFCCDVDHGQDGLDNVRLQFHLLFGLLQEEVGIFNATTQAFDLLLAVVDGCERIQLKLVVIYYVLEMRLLLLELSDPLLVDIALLLMVDVHLLYLLGQFSDLVFKMIVLLLGKIVPFFLLFLDETVSVPERLVEDLYEYFEDVVKQVCPNE